MRTTDQIGTFICKDVVDDTGVEPTDRFDANAPAVHLMYKTLDLPKVGDVYVIQWIAENVGSAAPPNTVIGTLHEPVTELGFGVSNFQVTSRLTRPTMGWPIGTYRVEVKRGGALVTAARFVVE